MKSTYDSMPSNALRPPIVAAKIAPGFMQISPAWENGDSVARAPHAGGTSSFNSRLARQSTSRVVTATRSHCARDLARARRALASGFGSLAAGQQCWPLASRNSSHKRKRTSPRSSKIWAAVHPHNTDYQRLVARTPRSSGFYRCGADSEFPDGEWWRGEGTADPHIHVMGAGAVSVDHGEETRDQCERNEVIAASSPARRANFATTCQTRKRGSR
jgi:hypothetical protein